MVIGTSGPWLDPESNAHRSIKLFYLGSVKSVDNWTYVIHKSRAARCMRGTVTGRGFDKGFSLFVDIKLKGDFPRPVTAGPDMFQPCH